MTHRLALIPALLATVLCIVGGCSPAPVPQPVRGTTYDPALHDRLPGGVQAAGVLRIATDASYAPASFFDTDGRTVVGFEPDLAEAIGRRLGVDVEFVVMGFEDVLGAVESGEVDVVMSAMTDTTERERRVDFVNYFSAGTAIVVQRGNPYRVSDLADLCGQVVAVEEGTVQVDLIAGHQRSCGADRIQVHAHATNSDALLELRTGRAAAVLNDYPPAAYLSNDPRTQADFQLASPAQYEPGLYGIGIAKQRHGLRAAVRLALAGLLASDEYEEILTTWDVLDGGVASISVNGG